MPARPKTKPPRRSPSRPPSRAAAAKAKSPLTSSPASATPAPSLSPAAQVAAFLAKFTPEVAALARTLRAKLRRRLPHAVELVYDNYNFLVFGFGTTERPSAAVLSLAVYARGVSLCFLHGARLPDPQKLLLGSGQQVRHIKLPTPATLDHADTAALIAAALASAPVPFDPTARPRLIIKSISAQQRPRRPATSLRP